MALGFSAVLLGCRLDGTASLGQIPWDHHRMDTLSERRLFHQPPVPHFFALLHELDDDPGDPIGYTIFL
jgi:hypothetical protein